MKSNNTAVEKAQIQALIENRVNAVRAKDVDGATASTGPEAVAFDVVVPLQFRGSTAVRDRLREWFSSFQGSIGYEVHHLEIVADENVAFSHSLNHVNGTLKNGGPLDMWWRSTSCYQKIAGRWTITHEHNSVPFDPKSGKPALDLKP